MGRKLAKKSVARCDTFTKVTIRLDGDLAVRVKVLAALEHKSISRLVQESLQARVAGLRLPGVVTSPNLEKSVLEAAGAAGEDAV
jgi:hypothetical protein